MLLGEHGFNVNEEDAQSHTGIHYPVGQDDVETTELLSCRTALNPTASTTFFSPLSERDLRVPIVKLLVDFGDYVNKSDNYGQTHHAILQYCAMFTFLRGTVKTINYMHNVERSARFTGKGNRFKC